MKQILFFPILFFALLVLPVNTFAIHNTAIVNVEVARDVSAPSGSFTASLTGDQEVPALTTSASGTAALTWDSRGLHYRITVNGLSGAITGAHFHNAPAGSNGGVVHNITGSFNGNSASGVWADPGAALLSELLAGNLYLNVHTADNPGGELRGQVSMTSGVGFWATMGGGQQNPPLTISATGTASLNWDKDGLHYRITVDGLSGAITGAHFHNAPAGQNGGVVHNITASFTGNTASGTWAIDDSALIDELIGGNLYLNVHTAENPGGEVRGQVWMTSGVRMTATLDGGQQNPPLTISATGTAALNWDGDGLRYRITVSGLSGAIGGAHFHSAPAGQNGGVVHNITSSFSGNTASGIWPGPPADMLVELLAGNLYLNVHTGDNPGGEVRGQVGMVSGVGFEAHLGGGQEVPPVTNSATGTASLNWDKDGLHYRITVDGLTGAITGAHFHNASAGQNGGVVHGITASFTGSTASGVWVADASNVGELIARNLYLNVHTAENPGGEVRGQVVQPGPRVGGLVVGFSRATSGISANYEWDAVTDVDGEATIDIEVPPRPALPNVGASGYYRARVMDSTGEVLGRWIGIPVRGGRVVDLRLSVGGRAAITGPVFGTPIEASVKPISSTVTTTVLSGVEPQAPIVSFGSVDAKTEGRLDLPVQIDRAGDLFAGDLILTYDPNLVALRTGKIGEIDLAIVESVPGRASLSFEGIAASEETRLLLSFERRTGDALGDMELAGVFYDNDLMPIAEVATEARLHDGLHAVYTLLQNYPNPFNPTTQIRYDLPRSGRVSLTIYNGLGQVAARLVDIRQDAGSYTVTWDAREMASGVYYYRLESGGFSATKRLVLLK